jgi:hypothetical protein
MTAAHPHWPRIGHPHGGRITVAGLGWGRGGGGIGVIWHEKGEISVEEKANIVHYPKIFEGNSCANRVNIVNINIRRKKISTVYPVPIIFYISNEIKLKVNFNFVPELMQSQDLVGRLL